jgi:hypothetical protein
LAPLLSYGRYAFSDEGLSLEQAADPDKPFRSEMRHSEGMDTMPHSRPINEYDPHVLD